MKNQEITVEKRDGRKVVFDTNKIENAIRSAFESIQHEYTEDDLKTLTKKGVTSINKSVKEDNNFLVSVERIQDIVEDVLMKSKKPDVAKEYIRYRAKRTQVRDANNDLMKLYHNIYFSSAEDMELKRDNANINGNSSMGIMLKCGSEGNKYFLLNHFLKPKYADAHKTGHIHIHK